jgi:DNA-binding CsgD family transcriptional regulator
MTELVVELKTIKEELEDHLTSINESSDEIEHSYSYITELDERVSLMEKKLDAILSYMAKLNGNSIISSDVKKILLSEQEKDIFRLFYESERALSYDDLCAKLQRSESYVRYYMNNLISKGVPIKRHSRSSSSDSKSYFTLDPSFRELQAKCNVVGISRAVTLDFFDQTIVKKR